MPKELLRTEARTVLSAALNSSGKYRNWRKEIRKNKSSYTPALETVNGY